MADGKQQHPAETAFRGAIDATGHLQWKAGLQAIKRAEGGGQIVGQDPKLLLGGAMIDDDCLKAYPSASRWDYVIGCRRANEPVAHFIEVHSATPSGVSEVEKKWTWLRDYLQGDTRKGLAKLKREFHWVASGKINIPQHTPQFKRLQASLRPSGLKGPVKHLSLA